MALTEGKIQAFVEAADVPPVFTVSVLTSTLGGAKFGGAGPPKGQRGDHEFTYPPPRTKRLLRLLGDHTRSRSTVAADDSEQLPDAVPQAAPVDASAEETVDIPVGASVGVWGVTDEGESFDYTYVQSESSPPAGPSLTEPIVADANRVGAKLIEHAPAESSIEASTEASNSAPISQVQAAAAVCSVFISDVDFQLIGGFKWETSQTCSGAFGDQRHRVQMWRSSWSGPRGYAPWSNWTGWTAGNFVSRNWSIGCGEGGTYDYYPVVQGDSSVLGRSPAVRSGNDERVACGTSPS